MLSEKLKQIRESIERINNFMKKTNNLILLPCLVPPDSYTDNSSSEFEEITEGQLLLEENIKLNQLKKKKLEETRRQRNLSTKRSYQLDSAKDRKK